MIKEINEVQEKLLTGEVGTDYVEGFLQETDKYLTTLKKEAEDTEQALKNLRGVWEMKKDLDYHLWFRKIWKKH